MASSQEFVDYVLEQLSDAGNITYRKMFGEYGIYLDGKIIANICENQFFLKITNNGREILRDIVEAPPYNGAKPYFLVEDLNDKEYLARLLQATYDELPAPKPKKPKKKK